MKLITLNFSINNNLVSSRDNQREINFMRNFNNFKSFFSKFKGNPKIDYFLKNPIAAVVGINTALYVKQYK